MKYCIDTNVLINCWYFWYPPDSHPTFWKGLEKLATEGRLGFPSQVLEELSVQDDDLYQWCKDREDLFTLNSSDEMESLVAELINKYPDFSGVDVGIGHSYADVYVIAQGITNNMRVVSMEKMDGTHNPRKFKIPHICGFENVKCIQPHEIIRLEGWIFTH